MLFMIILWRWKSENGTSAVAHTLPNPFHAPTPSEPQPRIKPSQSVFDDSYDSAEDLFGNSSQKIRLPFGRKKGSTPESVKKEETNKKSSTETKKQVAQGQVDIGVTKNPRSASIEEKLFDPLQDQAPHEDESAREVEVAPKAVVEQVANERNTSVPSSLNDIGEEVSDLERLTEAAGDFSKETEVMSTSSRVSVASNMKLKSKANDLFVAKLSATLGQGPPKIRQPAQPKNDAKNAEENENAASSATVPKPIPPPTTNDSLTSILKSRPKGPARRRPQQGISHPDAASTEAASASDDVKRVGIKTPQEVDSLPARNSMNEATSTDEKIETIVKVSETSSPAVTKKVSVTARTSSSASTKRSLFDDSDDDLFASHVTSSTKNNETEKTNTEKPSATVQARDVPVKPANRQIPKAAAVRKPGLFDESDSDSDLFK
ncbi:hypothetical protein L596_003930 [Steinernema carpocapsae]|uniref:Uncharacterized protein n=1 Tax=Steinernema carpocapsae TaxID=34508 RepID=A0A4U8UXH5_STECR|nr:hypothetical protein L596_003930 [Steinernema carpocapsae]